MEAAAKAGATNRQKKLALLPKRKRLQTDSRDALRCKAQGFSFFAIRPRKKAWISDRTPHGKRA